MNADPTILNFNISEGQRRTLTICRTDPEQKQSVLPTEHYATSAQSGTAGPKRTYIAQNRVGLTISSESLKPNANSVILIHGVATDDAPQINASWPQNVVHLCPDDAAVLAVDMKLRIDEKFTVQKLLSRAAFLLELLHCKYIATKVNSMPR